jgi:hypothetical protein
MPKVKWAFSFLPIPYPKEWVWIWVWMMDNKMAGLLFSFQFTHVVPALCAYQVDPEHETNIIIGRNQC